MPGDRLRAPEGVLEAQIEEEARPRRAAPRRDGVGHAGDDLEPAGEIEGPADAGIEEDDVVLAARSQTVSSIRFNER